MRRFSYFLTAFTSALNSLAAFFAAYKLWHETQDSSISSDILGLSRFIDIMGLLLIVLLLLSSTISAWTLYKRERYGLASMMAAFPLVLYLLALLMPHLF